LLTTTETPGMTAPVGSFTVPVKLELLGSLRGPPIVPPITPKPGLPFNVVEIGRRGTVEEANSTLTARPCQCEGIAFQ